MIKFEKFILNNGLRVIVHKDDTTPLVAFNLLYDVGAKDENPNQTGFAHLFEHLMFGGSINVKNYDKVLQKASGENNAFTNNDYTNYYITLPKQNLETAFYLESDRMLSLAFSQNSLDVQKNVVCEEFKQRYLNQPYGDALAEIRSLAYKKHPYQWQTIGKELSHITNASLDDVKSFFYKFYAPNNAILSIAGDVNLIEIQKLCEKWFGDIPKRNVPKRNLPQEPEQKEKRSKEIIKDVPSNALYMAYHTGGRTDDDYHATDLISDLLANGPSSLFNKILIKEKKLFPQIDAYIQGSIDPGLLNINARLFDTTSYEIAENTIKTEINKITNGDFSEKELTKVKNKSISNMLFSNIEILDIAMELAYFELLGNAELINSVEDNILEVSKSDIIKTAQKIFKEENLSCLYYKSKNLI